MGIKIHILAQEFEKNKLRLLQHLSGNFPCVACMAKNSK